MTLPQIGGADVQPWRVTAPGTKHPIHTQSCTTLSEQLHTLVSHERGIKTLPSLQLKTRKEGRDARLAEAPS